MDASLQGQLLLASPTLLDPSFRRTVVLVGVHNEDGAMGVVLNRPSETRVAEAVPQLEATVDGDELVYVGGPVQPTSVVLLAEFEDPDSAALLILGRIGFAAGGADAEDLSEATARKRVFAGYAGWSGGQLDEELEQGDWITHPAVPADVFSESPADLWADVLERKGGSYALLARMPLDPSVN
ncbi:MAG: YqgE/AlgH family protein [Solirubrobacteraceae bacterium]